MSYKTILSILLALSIGFFIIFVLDILPIKEVHLSQKQSELQYEISILKLELQKIEIQQEIKKKIEEAQ